MSKFNEQLFNLFKIERLSTVSGSKEIGISKTQLGRYLSGYYEPTLPNALKICRYFSCSLDFLLGLETKRKWYGELGSPNFELFLSRYKDLLNEAGVSHYAVAKKLKFNRNNLNYWKKTGSLPSLEILYNLAKYFNKPVEYLIGRID